MGQPIQLTCELCGSQATLDVNSHTDASGKRIEWPKAVLKPGGIFFVVNCPQCGSREQLMAEPGDT